MGPFKIEKQAARAAASKPPMEAAATPSRAPVALILIGVLAAAACTEEVTPLATGATIADAGDENADTSVATTFSADAPKGTSASALAPTSVAQDAGTVATTPSSAPSTPPPSTPANTNTIPSAPVAIGDAGAATPTTLGVLFDAGALVPVVPAGFDAGASVPPALQVDASAASISPECDAQTKKCNAAGPDLIRDCVAVARRCNPAGAAASPECSKQLDKCEQGPNYLLDCAAVTVVCGL
jgi:hypothetical protein